MRPALATAALLVGLLRAAVGLAEPADQAGAVSAQAAPENPTAAAPPAGAGPLSIEAAVEPRTATVGDRLHLTVRLERPEGLDVAFPDVARSIAPFEVISEVIRPPESAAERVAETRDYLIAAFKPGDLSVPRIEIAYVTASGETVRAFTDSLAVTIESVVPDTATAALAPKDLKPPVELPREWWPFLAAAAVAAAAYFAYRYLRNWWKARKARPEKPAAPPPVPKEAAHEAAFARLRALEADDPLSRAEIAAFYDRLSDIVRLYLGDRYAVKAIDMTTTELAPAMAEARMEPAEIEWTVRFLGHADLAKFAKLEPGLDRARGDFSAAWDFVERTRFRGEAPGAGAGPAGGGGGEAC